MIIKGNLEEEFRRARRGEPPAASTPVSEGVPRSASLLSDFFKPPQSMSTASSATPVDTKLSTKEKNALREMDKYSATYSRGIQSLSKSGFNVLASSLSRFAPEIRNPLLQSENFYLPMQTTRTGAPNVELNRWFAYYYKYHPLVGNLIDLHSELPLSRFGLKGVEDPIVLRFYEEMVEDMDMFLGMVNLLKTWFLFGESQPYLFWNDSLGRFDSIIFLDTSYIEVFGHAFFRNEEGAETRLYSLIPDPLLVELVNSNHPKIRELVNKNLPAVLIKAVKENKPVIMNNFNTEMILKTASPWDIRGTSILLGVLKDMMYEDKLREAQYAIAEAHVSPKWIWKLGHPGEYMPTTDDIIAFRDTLLDANNDPVFNLVTHYAVDLRVEGSSGRILPIIPELQWVESRILMRLFSNRALVTGEGVTYANASVALRALMSRYIPIRAMAENFFYRKVFLPTALANGFFKRSKADLDHRVRTSTEEIIMPQFNWAHKQNLLDDSNIKNMLLQLRAATEIPMKVICDALDLDYSEVKTFLQKEMGTVLDPTARKLREATITQKASELKESTLTRLWKKVLDVLQFVLPMDKSDTDVVKEETPVITGTPQQQETQLVGEETPPPLAPGGLPGAPIPEEAAEPPSAEGTEVPLGAGKKQFGGAPVFNRGATLKDTKRYFVRKDGKFRLRKSAKSGQFTFLKNVPNTFQSYSQLRPTHLVCTNCDWSQHQFLREDVANWYKQGRWDRIAVRSDERENFQKIIEGLHWVTREEFENDPKKLCPKCKNSTIKVIESVL